MLNIDIDPKTALYKAAKKATGLDDETLVQAALSAGLQALAKKGATAKYALKPEVRKSLRSRNSKADKLFEDGKAAGDWLRKRYA